MIRVFTFKMEGLSEAFRIASMTTAQADKHVEEAKEMMARHKENPLSPDEWKLRAQTTVCDALNRAGGNDDPHFQHWTPEKLAHELDIPTIEALFQKVLEFSGLKSGEAQAAASPSPKSAAA